MAVGRDPRTGRYIGSTFLKNNFEKCLLPLLVSYFVTNYFISADSYFSKFSQMVGYEDEMISPFPNLGSLSALLTEAVQRAVGAEDRERALRFELEHPRAQLAAADDRIRAIQEAWEKSKESLAGILNQVYQDCHYAHGGPRRRYVARKRLFTYPWGGKVKKTSYAPRVDDDRVPPPPQPASEEEEEDPEIRIYYDIDGIAESLGEHDPALRLVDFEDDA